MLDKLRTLTKAFEEAEAQVCMSSFWEAFEGIESITLHYAQEYDDSEYYDDFNIGDYEFSNLEAFRQSLAKFFSKKDSSLGFDIDLELPTKYFVSKEAFKEFDHNEFEFKYEVLRSFISKATLKTLREENVLTLKRSTNFEGTINQVKKVVREQLEAIFSGDKLYGLFQPMVSYNDESYRVEEEESLVNLYVSERAAQEALKTEDRATLLGYIKWGDLPSFTETNNYDTVSLIAELDKELGDLPTEDGDKCRFQPEDYEGIWIANNVQLTDKQLDTVLDLLRKYDCHFPFCSIREQEIK